MTKKPPTKAESEHMGLVAALGCLVCGCPAECHHVRAGVGLGLRSSHFDTIPLCPRHHRLGGFRIALHAGIKTWQDIFGTERELLERTWWLLGETPETMQAKKDANEKRA